MYWTKYRKNKIATCGILVLLILWVKPSLAQDEKLAISTFQVLDDFRDNTALAGYWGEPIVGVYYDGFLKEQVLSNYSFGGHFNMGLGKNGVAAKLIAERVLNNWFVSGQYSYSRAFELNTNLVLRAGAGFEFTYILSPSYDEHTFSNQIENPYSLPGESKSNEGFRMLGMGNFGVSLHSENYLVAISGNNLLPIIMYNVDHNEAYLFNSNLYNYLPPEFRATFAYEFTVGKDFELTPAGSWKFNVRHPQPYAIAHINVLWRKLAMVNFKYDFQGVFNIMLGTRIADRVSLAAGVSYFDNTDLQGFNDGQKFTFSILTQL